MTNNTEAEELMNEMLENFRKQPIQFVKPDLIKISEEFHFNGKGLWLGIERTPQPGADQIAEFLKARETLVNSFKVISGQTMTDYNSFAPEKISSTPAVIDYKAKERLEIRIDNAKQAGELHPYWDEAVKLGLQKEWENKVNDLMANPQI